MLKVPKKSPQSSETWCNFNTAQLRRKPVYQRADLGAIQQWNADCCVDQKSAKQDKNGFPCFCNSPQSRWIVCGLCNGTSRKGSENCFFYLLHFIHLDNINKEKTRIPAQDGI